MGVVVVLTKEDEVDGWWPEEGDQHSYSLVVGRTWRDSTSGEIIEIQKDITTLRLLLLAGSNFSEFAILLGYYFGFQPQNTLTANSLVDHL